MIFFFSSSVILIIFQWGIWIHKSPLENKRGAELDYLPMRNLNPNGLITQWESISLIIFQWGIWIFSFIFTYVQRLFLIIFQWGIWICQLFSIIFIRSFLIIFQWGIWIPLNEVLSPVFGFLDYLPMRNLNLNNLRFLYGHQALDYLPMRNLNRVLPKKSVLFSSYLIIFQWGIWIGSLMVTEYWSINPWLSSNEEFEWGTGYWWVSIFQLLDYLPMRNVFGKLEIQQVAG